MNTPQSGVLPEMNTHALFLTFRINQEAADAAARIRRACAGLPDSNAEIAAIDPAAGLVSVVAFGAEAWGRLFSEPKPTELEPFRAREQAGRIAPSTPADILLHLRAERRDLLFLLARRVRAALGDAVSLVEEVDGFRYLHNRDMTGFVDGTENPQGDERAEVSLVTEPPHAGGSYINMQRYIHDLEKFNGLEVGRQEAVIGRTKSDDEELEGGQKPPSAHISRVVIKQDGEELEILRHSMPYGNSSEAGLVFIAYANTPEHFNRMLDRMLFADDDGTYDHLMDYTRAVTGCAFFAPGLEYLSAIG